MNGKTEFEAILFESMSEVLTDILGEPTKKLVLHYIANNELLGEGDTARKPELFQEGLDTFFDEGSMIIKKSIVKSLYSKMNLQYEPEGEFSFLKCIEHAERACNPRH